MGAKGNDETVKYNLICKFKVDGVSSESDIVGALFGQTEGLLDIDMDLKQLQKSSRIGRINLELKVKSGKTTGTITLPSSLSKVETAIIAATLESVDRVGPSTCTITLDKIVDVRKSKRDLITKRASEIMKKWQLETREEVKNIPDIVEKDSKRGRVVKFGIDNLPAGSEIYHCDEVILVEGRADIINLMKMNINNTIAIKGTQIPVTIKNLSKSRKIIALLDGDRGGDMILKELALMGRIEEVARAPYKKEVEDLSYEEVKFALKNKVSLIEASFLSENLSVSDFISEHKGDFKVPVKNRQKYSKKTTSSDNGDYKKRRDKSSSRSDHRSSDPKSSDRKSSDRKTSEKGSYSKSSKKYDKGAKSRDGKSYKERRGKRSFREKISISEAMHKIIEKTKRTFNAVLVGESNQVLLTVKTSEVYDSLESTDGVTSVVLDGVITQRMLDLAEQKSVKLIAGAMVGEIKNRPRNLQYVTFNRI